MKTYLKTGKFNHMMILEPGRDSPCSDFLHKDKSPIQFVVKFEDGVADVPENLAFWMEDKGMSQKSPIIEAEHARIIPGGEQRVIHRLSI